MVLEDFRSVTSTGSKFVTAVDSLQVIAAEDSRTIATINFRIAAAVVSRSVTTEILDPGRNGLEVLQASLVLCFIDFSLY